jgi:hypothetical protein
VVACKGVIFDGRGRKGKKILLVFVVSCLDFVNTGLQWLIFIEQLTNLKYFL